METFRNPAFRTGKALNRIEGRYSSWKTTGPSFCKELADSLRSMDEGMIARTVYPEVPPEAEYVLIELRESMRPLIEAMEIWAMVSENRREEARE